MAGISNDSVKSVVIEIEDSPSAPASEVTISIISSSASTPTPSTSSGHGSSRPESGNNNAQPKTDDDTNKIKKEKCSYLTTKVAEFMHHYRMYDTKGSTKRDGGTPVSIEIKETLWTEFCSCSRGPYSPTSEEYEKDERILKVPTEDGLGYFYARPLKYWQFFPGDNQFFLDGRLMITSQPQQCIYWWCLFGIHLLFLLFSLTVGIRLHNCCWGFDILTGLCYVACVGNMTRVSFMDPGIVPRATKSEMEDTMSKNKSHRAGETIIKTQRVEVNGQIESRNWCPTCNFYKPPRVTHCAVCNNCVTRFDHHCPFLGNCVGQRNYSAFIAFLLSVVITSVLLPTFCIIDVCLIFLQAESLGYGFAECIGPIITSVICIAFLASMVELVKLHFRITGCDETTLERMKGVYDFDKNPYDSGKAWRNRLRVIFGARVPSALNLRWYLTRKEVEELVYKEVLYDALRKKYGPKAKVFKIEGGMCADSLVEVISTSSSLRHDHNVSEELQRSDSESYEPGSREL